MCVGTGTGTREGNGVGAEGCDDGATVGTIEVAYAVGTCEGDMDGADDGTATSAQHRAMIPPADSPSHPGAGLVDTKISGVTE